MLLSKRWITVIAVLVCLAGVAAGEAPGRFTGEAVLMPLKDGRNMQLVKPFGYVDPEGKAWEVPAGATTDGASIPRVLWVTHPPFTGKYRLAAVVHDYYCQERSRGWKETHKVFYDAMRTSGVPEQTAKVMYGAVYKFGPRWGPGSERAAGVREHLSVDKQMRFVRDLTAWIKRDNPSAEEIGDAVDAGRIAPQRD